MHAYRRILGVAQHNSSFSCSCALSPLRLGPPIRVLAVAGNPAFAAGEATFQVKIPCAPEVLESWDCCDCDETVDANLADAATYRLLVQRLPAVGQPNVKELRGFRDNVTRKLASAISRSRVASGGLAVAQLPEAVYSGQVPSMGSISTGWPQVDAAHQPPQQAVITLAHDGEGVAPALEHLGPSLAQTPAMRRRRGSRGAGNSSLSAAGRRGSAETAAVTSY